MGKKQEKRTAREKKEKLEACLRRKAGENFCVDAITWNDLDLDAVFDTVDHTVSVCGEEYLYTALRMPVTTTEIREERERLMKLLQRTKSQRSSAESTSFDGKRKDESADRRNSRTDGGGAGREGEISSDGRYCCAWN